MRNEIERLYRHVRSLQFPRLGGKIGDFLLYDSLLVGVAQSYTSGEAIDQAILSGPDTKTMEAVAALRHKDLLSEEERQFLDYFEALDSLRQSILRDIAGDH
jgi:hypothetical protein